MKNKTTIYCMLTVITLVFSSCKKLVDAGDPLTTITSDKAFSKDGSAYATLAALYSMMMNGLPSGMTFSNGGMTIYPAMSSDEMVNYAGVSNQMDYDFSANNLASRNGYVKQYFWDPAYRLIFNANAIIEGIASSTSNQLTPAARVQITAEAKFIRAFNYFYLVNLFGDLPLVTGTDWKQNAQVSRSPVAKVYELMLSDLLAAEKDLPTDYQIGGGERIRVNKMTAKALLARVYLYQKDWKNAATKATEIISDNRFVLEPDLASVFLATSRESIWQLKPSLSQPNYVLLDVTNFTPALWWKDLTSEEKPSYLEPGGLYELIGFAFYPNYILTTQFSRNFEAGDQRLEQWTSFVETPSYAPYTGVTDHFPTKYLGSGTKYFTVFRLAEQYLIRAEARAQLNDLSGADQDMNMIRQRAGLNSINSVSQSDALDRVAKERCTELFAEWGHRWFDLKRTGKAAEALKRLPYKKTDPNQLLYPIPYTEITADPGLVQNPGY